MTGSAFVDAVLASGAPVASRPALIGVQGAMVTHAQLARYVAAAEQWYASCRVGAGDRVFVHLPNSIDWPIAVLGAMALGAQVAVCPASMTELEIGQRLQLVRPRLVVTTPPQVSGLQAVVTGQVPVRAFNRDGQLETADAVVKTDRSSRPDRFAAALIQFSSGTTGHAKAVVLSSENLLRATAVIGTHFELGSVDRAYTLAPYAHAMGAVVTVASALLAGAAVVTDSRPDPRLLPRGSASSG